MKILYSWEGAEGTCIICKTSVTLDNDDKPRIADISGHDTLFIIDCPNPSCDHLIYCKKSIIKMD